ncbi:MAG: RHS repeat protein, partial [Eubacterium sp.]|nr:RHS repeat protein [Eubacterium sp.]
MDRIFKVSEIEDIITKDKKVIKDVLDVIGDIKSVATSASQHIAEVPAEALSGDVLGAASTVQSSIDNTAYDDAKKKLTCCEKNLGHIEKMDSFYAKEISKLTKSTNKIKKVINGLNNFILNTPLDTPSKDYGALLSAKIAVWEKILKDADSDIDAIKKAAKGGELFSSIFSSDPVNLSTGNFIYNKTDLAYSGIESLCFKRFYNSVNEYEGILGKDWITNFEIRLFFKKSKVFDSSEITIIKEDGKEEIFLPADEHRYVPEFNSLAEIHILEDGYEYVTLDGSRSFFDKEGILKRYENSNGQGYSLEYQEQSQDKTEEDCENSVNKSVLHKVIKDSGEYFVFAYSEDGYLNTVTDSEGRIVTYRLEDRKLTSVTMPDGSSFKYIYSASGKLRGVINPRDIVTVENDYDDDFRVTKQHFPDGTSMSYDYDDENMIVTQTERNGAVTKHYHDEYMRNIKNVYPDGEESFSYNARSQKTKIIDKNGNETKLSYDNRGNLTGIINALGTKLSVTYNNLNKPMTGSIDGKTKFRNSYDSKGNLIETEDGLGRKNVLRYNESGKPVQITAADGSVTDVTYDTKGNITEIKDAQGNTTKYSYDELNRVIEITEPTGAKRSFRYDVMDNITEETNAEGQIRSYKYNESGKVTEITDYDGHTIKRTYNVLNKPETVTDKEGRQTKLQYDSMWNLARVTAPDGGKTTYIYNENNRLTRIKDALGNTTRFIYDGLGNILSEEDSEGIKTYYEYDPISRLTKVIDAEGYEIKYEYDNESNLIKIIDKAGNILTRIVDEAGQVIEERIVPVSANEISEGNNKNQTAEQLREIYRRYTYDLLGNVTSVTTETGLVTKYSYLPVTDKVTEVIYNDGNRERYAYNPNGYMASRTDIYGNTQKYTYDSLNRLVEITGTDGESKKYTYDVLGNMTSMTDVLGNVTKYEYSLSGKLTKVTDALGNFAEYTYDLNDRLIAIKQNGTPEEPPRITEYKRNLLGQVETVIDAIGQQENYKYNKRGELIEKIDKDGYITKYGYTSRGDMNHLQYSDGREVMLSYDALRHLTEVKDWLGITSI